ncbi:hypothetical protein J2S78_000229 [Salibacterium salarium]|nr:hypothetical protein [Salibacterium salarium]
MKRDVKEELEVQANNHWIKDEMTLNCQNNAILE